MPATTTVQPVSLQSMDLYKDFHAPGSEFNEKDQYAYDYEAAGEHAHPHQHKKCHASRLRRIFMPIVAAFFLAAGILAATCFLDSYFGLEMGLADMGSEFTEGLVRRATDPNSQNGMFIDRKYYLIVIFVGLFFVVLAGICLSAWCCRGAFENPLCCPCYLCACCGGLACLECIGCGLCAEAADQM